MEICILKPSRFKEGALLETQCTYSMYTSHCILLLEIMNGNKIWWIKTAGASYSRHLPLSIKTYTGIKAAAALLGLPSFSIKGIIQAFVLQPTSVSYFFIVMVSINVLSDQMHHWFSFPPIILCFFQFDSDQQWFPAHWFVGFGGINCVILGILPWHDSRGRGWWEKRDKNRSSDKSILVSCGRCFFKSIFSTADRTGHSSGKKTGWLYWLVQWPSMMLNEEEGRRLAQNMGHGDTQQTVKAW